MFGITYWTHLISGLRGPLRLSWSTTNKHARVFFTFPVHGEYYYYFCYFCRALTETSHPMFSGQLCLFYWLIHKSWHLILSYPQYVVTLFFLIMSSSSFHLSVYLFVKWLHFRSCRYRINIQLYKRKKSELCLG